MPAESAVRARDKIQIFLPPLTDVLTREFVGLAKNLAYVVTFGADEAAVDFSGTSFTIDARAGASSTDQTDSEQLSLPIHMNANKRDCQTRNTQICQH